MFNQANFSKRKFCDRSRGIRVVGKGNWKKREVGKPAMKLERMKLERMKLESSRRSWKVRAEVGKLGLKLKSTTEVGK